MCRDSDQKCHVGELCIEFLDIIKHLKKNVVYLLPLSFGMKKLIFFAPKAFINLYSKLKSTRI